jgi:phosphatidate cytidylyltransferase
MPSASFSAANGGTVPRAADTERRNLTRRIASIIVIAPVALAAVYAGGLYFVAAVAVVALLMGWEWDRICGDQRFAASGWTLCAALAAIVVLAAGGRYGAALAASPAAALAVYLVARLGGRPAPLWTALGAVVIGVACIAMLWLRTEPVEGLRAMLWLIGSVAMTDTFAYFVGRGVGGPRLAPVISPRKTWAGLFGGMAGAVLFGLAWGWWLARAADPALLGAMGAATAVIAQGGDLGISVVKRRFGVKDASHIIPGHGGVLDRLDGLLSATPALALVLLVWSEGRLTWY